MAVEVPEQSSISRILIVEMTSSDSVEMSDTEISKNTKVFKLKFLLYSYMSSVLKGIKVSTIEKDTLLVINLVKYYP